MIKRVMVDGAEALKLMVDGKVAWERCVLPAGYQKCAFLQSDGQEQTVTTGNRKWTVKVSECKYIAVENPADIFARVRG